MLLPFLVTLAAVGYTANAALGTAVRRGRIDTSERRWPHHALYTATMVLTAAAASSLWWRPGAAGWVLLPAVVLLAALPLRPGRTRGHLPLALAPVPCYLFGLVLAWR